MAIPAIAGGAATASGAAGAGAGAASASSAGSAAAVSGGMTIFSSILNNAVNWKLQQEQRNLQRDVNAQNEALMREAWARDDTARQRMVKDLEAAGLSKWLAAGASPMSSSPVSLSAPSQTYKADYDFGSAADKALHAYQTALYGEQTRQQTLNLQEQNKLLREQIRQQIADADVAEHNRDVYENRSDIASNDPAEMKILRELINQLQNPNSTIRQSRLYKLIFGNGSSSNDFSDTNDPEGFRKILGDEVYEEILKEAQEEEKRQEEKKQEFKKNESKAKAAIKAPYEKTKNFFKGVLDTVKPKGFGWY